jgi:hypothetical protein
MAEKDIKLRIDAAVDSAEAAKSLGQLKKALLEIQSIQAEVGDTSGENFDKLAAASSNAATRLAETRDAIGDIQDRTRTLEGTPVERLTGSFNLLKESIFTLDFDKAKIGAEGLLNTFTPVVDGKLVTGFGGIGGAVSNLGGTFKNLGSTVVNLGKQILANPIFLLAAIITVVVVAVIKLLDSLGLLKPILDAIKAAIGFVVDAFKALTDWLGLTDNAAEEAAENAKKQGEKRVKAAEDVSKSQQDLYNLTKDLTDEEIKLLEKRLGVQLDTSRNIFDIQMEESEAKKQALQDEVDALNAKRDLTDEDKARLAELTGKIQEENNKQVQLEQQKQAAIIKGARNADNILQSLRAKSIENENQRSKAFLDIAEKEALAKLEQAKREAKQLGDDATVKKLEEAITLTKKDFANQRKKIDDDANKAASDARKKASDDAVNNSKTAAGKELKALQDAEKLKVLNTEEGTQARVNAEIAAIDKIEAFQKKNLKLLNLTKDQILIIEKENIEKRKELQDEFDKSVLDAANKEKQTIAELNLLKSEAITNEFDRNKARLDASIQLAEAERDIALSDTELTASEREKIELETTNKIAGYKKELTDLEIAENQKRLADDQLVAETKLSQAEFDAELTKGTLEQEIAEVENIKNLKLETLESQRQAELANTELTESERAAIEEKYRQQTLTAEQEASDKIIAMKQAETAAKIDTAGKYAQSVNNLAATVFAISDGFGKQDEKSKEERAKRQFNVQKALNLGLAIIDGVKAVQASLAQSPIAIGPIPNPAGIASLAFAVSTSIANIAKIAASKYESKSAAPPPPPPPGGGGGGGIEGGASQQATFSPTQFFGLGQGGPSGGSGNGGQSTKVYVTETDITSTQNRVRVIEDRAVIG